MNNRPIEKMLNPASINEYRRLSGEYGFDPFVIEPDFDQNSFIRIWNEQSKTAKKKQHILVFMKNTRNCF